MLLNKIFEKQDFIISSQSWCVIEEWLPSPTNPVLVWSGNSSTQQRANERKIECKEESVKEGGSVCARE